MQWERFEENLMSKCKECDFFRSYHSVCPSCSTQMTHVQLESDDDLSYTSEECKHMQFPQQIPN